MRYFGRRYRCIAFNARGYPPSDVPDNVSKYSQERARDDIKAVLDALKLDKAHVVGLSMGGFRNATLRLHLSASGPCHWSFAGCGYGASGDKKAQFAAEVEAAAARFEQLGMGKAAEGYASAPSRVQFQNKDPRGWREFADQLAGNSTRGAALTMRGVQARRPSLFDLVEQMKAITAPTLVVSGDEDWPCLEPGILMKRTIPTAGLVVMPNCGHTMNLEEPAAFNQHSRRLPACGGNRPLADTRSTGHDQRHPRQIAGHRGVRAPRRVAGRRSGRQGAKPAFGHYSTLAPDFLHHIAPDRQVAIDNGGEICARARNGIEA
jgi:pimeloyl-ACP methyl ester carboxylesterase